MYKRFASFLLVLFLFVCSFSRIKAESIIWSNSSFTDCSWQGGTNSTWDNLCFDKNGNFADSATIGGYYYDNVIEYKITVIPGHTYIYQDSVNNFSNTGTDIVVRGIYTEPGMGNFVQGTYTGNNWAYMNTGAQFTNTFVATSDYVYLVYFSACASSSGCYVSNASLTDLGDTALSSPWFQITSFARGIASHWVFIYNDRLYVAGGGDPVSPPISVYAGINSNGTLSTWQNTSSPFPNIYWITGAQKDDYIYILGGANTSDNNNIDKVLFARIESNGDITDWGETTSLPIPLSLGGSAISNNKIYYAGGVSDSHNLTTSATKLIYKSNINPTDGTLGAWAPAGYLPEKIYGFNVININNYLYIFGGYREQGVSSKVQRALIDPVTGQIGQWDDLTSFPKPIARSGITRVGNTIISVGGYDGTVYIPDIYYAFINSNGTLSQWFTSSSTLPNNNCCFPLVNLGNRLFITGGHDGNNYFKTVYSGIIDDLISIPEETPTPTPLPASKVVFLPGMGASWNADAILNCKTDGYSGTWEMAPFAKSVYENILSALPASNWNTKPFYYDWRRDVKDNALTLSTFINDNAPGDEKVNLVGHSMGGLVGRAYLESQQGQKVDSYLSVGSPHQGSALAYPLVSGGEIWDSNLITKIAKTILIKRCGDNIPSIQNLLPTTDYLKDGKTNQLKPVANMVAKNNWLPTSFSIPFGNVKIGTLSGTGFPTLNIIKVNNPSKHDTQLGNWLDGKPIGKEKVDQGDGTVLTSSSQLTNADNQIINQNHSGLVASQEGISKILDFLGTAPAQGFRFVSPVLAADIPSTTVYNEPNSMMVIIGYPGNFWVTDPDGVVTKDDQGIVSYPTPKSGEYKLEIIPTSGDTLFIITQVLPNGITLYKEYKISGYQPTSKIINLDTMHPSEDILKDPKPKKEIKNEQEDHHFWDDFWKHFHKD